MYMIVAISESSNVSVEFPPKVSQILTDFSDIIPDELPHKLPL